MKQAPPDAARRRLLARARDAAAAGAAVALLPAAVPAAPATPPLPGAAPRPAHRGYRDSERNRRYYELARF